MARVAWAKSDPDPVTQEIRGWLPVYQHLADTAAVAGFLWDGWLPPSVKSLIAESVGAAGDARDLAVWLAGTHDLGKVSPAFAVQVPVLASVMQAQGLIASPFIEGTEERRIARHEIVSHLTVSAWLQERYEYDQSLATKMGSVLAAHHGRPPGPVAVHKTAGDPRLHGDGPWARTRLELLEAMTAELAVDPSRWRGATLTQPALALLSAFVIVADWIASSSYFPLVPPGTQPTESAVDRAERAWREIGLPAPWSARAPADDRALFHTRFGIDGEPRPVQSEMMRLAREVEAPTLMILEADTGIGKTEAALAAAEILCARFGRSGIFFGLPTQATADGMFARLLSWAERLELEEPLTVFLAHGKARLNEQNAVLRRIAFGGLAVDDPEDHLVTAHAWLADAKRGPLSSLVVGTIDQALFGALRSRHVALRHLALAGKVVVLDEVHAYDAFMNQYLERILHWLGAYGVPVIMLSATLPAERRKSFVRAYESGRPRPLVRRSRSERRASASASGEPSPPAADALDGDIGYPSIVVARPHTSPLIVRPPQSGRERTIRLDHIDDDPSSLRTLLSEALSDGGCAVVIRNTVRRVQETAADLRELFRADSDVDVVTVAHSRFLGLDRAGRDRHLLDLFGPDGRRPAKHVVVASQVVEQSLDIDFDLMVSDIAPVDLLLQRAGRLHRHRRADRPPRLQEPRLVLTGAAWQEDPPEMYRDNTRVYDRSVLLRTLAVLHERTTLDLPADIPVLVQEVYEEPAAPLRWPLPEDEARLRAEERRATAESKAQTYRLDQVDITANATLLDWIKYDAGDPDRNSAARGAVRDAEETLEVLVLQEDEDKTLRTPSWLSRNKGIAVPTEALPSPWLSDVILGCSLRLPLALCRGPHIDQHIRTLEHRYPAPAWHGSHALRGELILVLDANGRAHLDPFDLHYSPKDGLTFTRSSPSESELPL
ncbi:MULTISPECIES: CRISPR-associated helicase Cas3' [Bacteria]|uniref:CRISPR-associated helicase Cas3' n=1 Tax=Bacteria TaxID=2 RepID=UPI003C7C0586